MKFATENEVDSKHLKLWLVVSITWKMSFVVLGIVIKIIRKLDHSHIVALCENMRGDYRQNSYSNYVLKNLNFMS